MVAAALLVFAAIDLTGPSPSSPVAFALLACGVVLLLASIRVVVVPLVANGKLPDGRYVAEVRARRGRHEDRPGEHD